MRVLRIGAPVFTRTRKGAFSGQGGVHASARWHSAGRPIVYTAQSFSLAALEILVRLKQTNDIPRFYAYSMEIPDHFILTPKSLPVSWKSRIAVSRVFWRCVAQGERSTGTAGAHRDHSRRMECSRKSPPSAVLTEMGGDGVPTPTHSTRDCCRSRKGLALDERYGINDTTTSPERLMLREGASA